MTKLVVGFLVTVAAQVALAQANPKMAYTKTVVGKGKNPSVRTVYVANADGSNANAVFTTTSIVGDVEVSPNSDKVFIIDDKSLRVFDLTVSGSTVTASNEVIVDNGLSSDGAAAFGDWSADGSSILYMNAKYGLVSFKIVSPNGALLFLHQFNSTNAGIPKFLGSTHVAFVDYCYGPNMNCVRTLDLNTLAMTDVYYGGVETIETSKSSATIIVNSGRQIKAVDANTQAVTLLVNGTLGVQDGVLSDDDSTLYFRRQVSSRSSDQVVVKKDILTSAETVLSTSGQLRNLDAH